MNNEKIVTEYFKKYLDSYFMQKTDLEYRALLKILNKKDKQVKNSLIPDVQDIEDELWEMHKMPVNVNIKGLKFKFYAEFLSGALWMRKRILGNAR